MRVLYVCADRGIPLRGGKGASVHVRQITAALQRLGHEVTLAVENVEGDAPLPEVTRVVPLPDDLDELIAGADVVVERYSLQSGAAREASARAGSRFVLEVNAPLVAEAGRFRGLEDLDRWEAWETATWSAADDVVAVSGPLVAQVARRAPGTRVHLLRNGVVPPPPVDRAAARAALGLSATDVALVFVGSMKPWHGVLELLEASEALPDHVRLLVAGHGPLEEDVRRAAARRRGRVTVLGALPHAEVPRLLGACDAGVAPYLPMPDFYFCPLKVTEYLASGLPVVFSDEGDVADVVGDAGLAVPAGDVQALSDALLLLAKDDELRTRLAAAARAQVAGAGWDDVAARLVEIVRTRA